MLGSWRTSGLVLVLVAAGCSLENPVADFGPDSGPPAENDGGTDATPVPDTPSVMDSVTIVDSTEPDVQEQDALGSDTENDVMSSDAGMDVLPPPMDSGVDVSPPPMDAGVDVPPVDTGVDVPPPPVDTGVDVPVVVDSGAHDSGTPVDVPPASCNGFAPCPGGQTCTDAFGGHCVPCGGSGQSCCVWWSCNSGLTCNCLGDNQCS